MTVVTVLNEEKCEISIADRCCWYVLFFLMIRRPPRSTQSRSSAASDVYKRQSSGCPLMSAGRARRTGRCMSRARKETQNHLILM